MNVSQLGFLASIAATPLAQTRGSEVERTQQESVAHDLVIDSAEQAEAAEGIGDTHEQQSVGDRDADGRRAWELGPAEEPGAEEEASTDDDSHHAPDPTGQAGSQLDLCG